ncbi:LcrR family type III secretion system chaperone [Pseudomonas sp. TH08]|uniref:LcrR family type III secretion system chaperone n=1 Tax=unclassified Pseudomonas TaxID=196821 RepID=UPI0019128AA5|nr:MULTISPECIES: LcrR family type III secretion system chaperone [unclassified Pseudomonas]MBK5527059.1 LcrR family type III secretion system chaperone [Pseudomonas sp. TH06]MBK5531682.1 LcrR family type III secretion system chaperone [Pseudomonas sp. TH08]
MSGDPLTHWLQAKGYDIQPHFLRQSSLSLGWRFVHGGCELAWRCEGSRVWIVMLRRVDGRRGLGNSFAALYVLAEAVLAVLGPQAGLYGKVDAMAGSPLEGQRMERFYRRWTGAAEPQAGWFELQAGHVCSLQSMRKRQKIDRA